MDVVNKSAISNIAIPYLQTNDEENRQWRDRKLFLAQKYMPLKAIQKYYHFRAEDPGYVYVKTDINSPVQRRHILKKNVLLTDTDMPPGLSPAGLTRDRHEYLYLSVRPYVWERYKNPPALGTKKNDSGSFMWYFGGHALRKSVYGRIPYNMSPYLYIFSVLH